ncbi:hypothetical protein CS542_05290 [Pedobacter sp. IW39]|nr:hypothetical protein CS542_05290 [Pedobacter sp. IW39]
MVFLIVQSANVYRIKGIIYSHLFRNRIILQTVGNHFLSPLVRTGYLMKLKTRIVVIERA